MSEKVLGFYKKDAGITCAKCYYVYCDELKCPNPDCGEINKEDIITFNRSELVPVRLRKESVDLKWLEERLKKSVDGCIYALKHKNTEKGPHLLKEDEIRVKQSLFLYKEWLSAVRVKAKEVEKK
ncbi:MAG TPA: hypothetical protein VMW25_02115 [Clostridia bacterium]|nr:hypothetical protein [Clostridia bacterium]